MKDALSYNGFIGSVQFSADDDVFCGKIEGIDDLVSYEGTSVAALKKAFRDAVEDYLELCKKAGKQPFKSCKGSFNVRISKELHLAALKKAAMEKISLNQLVKKALEQEIMAEQR
ncbi:type II toxin-antitoxin system HicB family antitoxin [Thermodesulfobacteriota bacterium]